MRSAPVCPTPGVDAVEESSELVGVEFQVLSGSLPEQLPYVPLLVHVLLRDPFLII